VEGKAAETVFWKWSNNFDVGGFRRGQVAAVVDGRKTFCTTKAGGGEEGLVYFLRL